MDTADDMDMLRHEVSASSSDLESQPLSRDSYSHPKLCLFPTQFSSSEQTSQYSSESEHLAPQHFDVLAVQTTGAAHIDSVRAIIKIEMIFEQITSCLLSKSDPVIHLRRRVSTPRVSTPDISLFDAPSFPASEVHISFPGSTKQEAWQFSVLVRILGLMHEALQAGVVTTKRDIFYKDPALFVKQSVVDRYVDDIAFTLGLRRTALNVAAAPKGLCAGAFAVLDEQNTYTYRGSTEKTMLVPELRQSDRIHFSRAKFILVIEKEATFHSLLSTDRGEALLHRAIVITGKGYPDIATRAFLHRLSNETCSDDSFTIPIYALVDYDPDGLAILSTYKFGSRALAHENDLLIAPNMRWLGLTSHDLTSAMGLMSDIEMDALSATGGKLSQGLLPLSLRDRKKAISMLRWPQFEEDSASSLRRELQIMLMLNTKAELQILDESTNGLQQWIMHKLDSV